MKKKLNPDHTLRVVGVFLCLFVVMLIRAWPRWSISQIWAEDGDVFLASAWNEGTSSLFTPFAGYFHCVPRLIAYVGSFLPLEYIPTFFVFLVMGLHVGIYLRPLGRDFSEFVPSFGNRVLFSVGLFFTGGFIEGFGTLANLHWFFSVYFMLLMLRNLDSRLGWGELAFLFLVGGSSGEIAVFLPLVVYRGYLKFRHRFSCREEIILGGMLLFWAAMNFWARTPSYENSELRFVKIVEALLYTHWNALALQPLIGDALTEWLPRGLVLLYWILGGLILVGYARFFATRLKKNFPTQLLFGAYLSTMAMLVLMWKARSGLMGIFGQIERSQGLSDGRHSIVISVLAFTLLFYFLHEGKKAPGAFPRRHRVIPGVATGRLLVFVLLYVALAAPRFVIPHYRGDLSWREELQKAQRLEGAEFLEVPINPPPSRAKLRRRD